MIQTFLLFLISNLIFLTIEITISRILLLLLITIITLKVLKWWQQQQKNDKLMISPLPEQMDSLIVVEVLAEVVSILLLPQSPSTYLSFITIFGTGIAIAYYTSPSTLFLTFFNAIAVLELYRSFKKRGQERMRSRLGILKTNSIYYTPDSPPKKEPKGPSLQH